ncbi:hypothetical protein OG735_00635 [Streptomyces sp. NBC_01210]|nr:hypothetical protein OG735_00635 [Streptomyces sp. NBC_01210]
MKQQAYPEAVEAAHADFAALHGDDIPRPRPSLATEGTSPVETS